MKGANFGAAATSSSASFHSAKGGTLLCWKISAASLLLKSTKGSSAPSSYMAYSASSGSTKEWLMALEAPDLLSVPISSIDLPHQKQWLSRTKKLTWGV